MNKLEQIKHAVETGTRVFWKTTDYEVKKDPIGQFLIVHKDSVIGLTRNDNDCLNGKPEDFFFYDPPLEKKPFDKTEHLQDQIDCLVMYIERLKSDIEELRKQINQPAEN
jgi:hypothetical protein